MPRTLDEVVATLPAGERAKIEARARELIAEEMSLQDLRKAIGKTQAAIAKRLKVGQDAVSKLETRSDMYISTLRSVEMNLGLPHRAANATRAPWHKCGTRRSRIAPREVAALPRASMPLP